jgi:hypothetical protein
VTLNKSSGTAQGGRVRGNRSAPPPAPVWPAVLVITLTVLAIVGVVAVAVLIAAPPAP